MGLEAKCRVRIGRQLHDGTALLETDDLLFRDEAPKGKRSTRLKIPLRSIRSVAADSGELHVVHDDGEMRLLLGDAAPRWAERIRSPRSLLDKLDVKRGQRVSVVGVEDEAFLRDLRDRLGDGTDDGASLTVGRLAKASDVVFLGASTQRDLARIERAAGIIARAGAVWVVHPKGKGGLRDTEVFAAAKAAGLTYTKVARFSETHTAEKLVIPRADR